MFNYPLLNLLLYFNLIVNLKAFNLTSKNNLVAYWGQNSYGNSEEAHKDSHERPMSDYCKDQTYDTIVISFLIKFNAEIKNGHPVLNMGKHCSKKFPNSLHPYCPEVAAGIKYCQNQGKKVLLSMGGYAGDYTLKDDESAKNFAQRVWDLYLGGKTDHRPFGEVALDGIDLDIEKGPPESYAVFSNKLKEIIDGQKEENKKEYFITAAPQCPFPDQYLKNVLEHGWLDAVFVQFYNNECAIGKDGFNFATWDGWARFASKNKNVKIFLGAPGGPTAASSGYLNFQELEPIINEVKEKYPSFGGVMLWDISQADQNICPDVKKIYSAAVSHLLKGEYEIKQPGNNKIKGEKESEDKEKKPEKENNEKEKKPENQEAKNNTDRLPKKDRGILNDELAKNRMPDSSLMDLVEIPSEEEISMNNNESGNENKDSTKTLEKTPNDEKGQNTNETDEKQKSEDSKNTPEKPKGTKDAPEKSKEDKDNLENSKEKEDAPKDDKLEETKSSGSVNSTITAENLPKFTNNRSLIVNATKPNSLKNSTEDNTMLAENIKKQIEMMKNTTDTSNNFGKNSTELNQNYKANSTSTIPQNETNTTNIEEKESKFNSTNIVEKEAAKIDLNKTNSTLSSNNAHNTTITDKDKPKVDLSKSNSTEIASGKNNTNINTQGKENEKVDLNKNNSTEVAKTNSTINLAKESEKVNLDKYPVNQPPKLQNEAKNNSTMAPLAAQNSTTMATPTTQNNLKEPNQQDHPDESNKLKQAETPVPNPENKNNTNSTSKGDLDNLKTKSVSLNENTSSTDKAN